MEATFEKEYHAIEQTHFWFRSRRTYILNLLKDAPKDVRILDIGCSSGILLNELIQLGFQKENLYGVDISSNAIANCKSNGIEHAFVMDAQQIDLPVQFDYIIASDCLEHLEDDAKALENWHSLLRPVGTLLVFVPAFMTLWSEHDEVNMHFRRYKKSGLKRQLLATNFEIEKASYWNFFLFPPILVVRLLGRLKSKKSDQGTGDLEGVPAGNGLLYNIINLENKMLRGMNLPFGVSTFCIANKRGNTTS